MCTVGETDLDKFLGVAFPLGTSGKMIGSSEEPNSIILASLARLALASICPGVFAKDPMGGNLVVVVGSNPKLFRLVCVEVLPSNNDRSLPLLGPVHPWSCM